MVYFMRVIGPCYYQLVGGCSRCLGVVPESLSTSMHSFGMNNAIALSILCQGSLSVLGLPRIRRLRISIGDAGVVLLSVAHGDFPGGYLVFRDISL
jgi:hypothetical protein